MSRHRGKHVYWFKSGRLAYYQLLQHLSTQSKKRQILLPAYHCRSMIEPCEWAGFGVVYYAVNEDLSPNTADTLNKITEKTAAVVLVHNFGFPNLDPTIIQECRLRSLILIEDACHLDPLDSGVGMAAGDSGDFVISSPRKFYDIYDGGTISGKVPMEIPGSFKFSIPRFLDEGRAFKFHLERIHKMISKKGEKKITGATAGVSGESVSSNNYVDSRFSNTKYNAMTFASRTFLSLMRPIASSKVRRENYGMLSNFLGNMPRCNLLFPDRKLPDSPYVLPLILKHPLSDYAEMRRRGLNALRWENIASSDCAVSSLYEECLVQIPLDWKSGSDEARKVEETLVQVLG